MSLLLLALLGRVLQAHAADDIDMARVRELAEEPVRDILRDSPVHELAPERPLIKPPRDAIGEADQEALPERLVRPLARARIEPLPSGDLEELLEERSHLVTPQACQMDAFKSLYYRQAAEAVMFCLCFLSQDA